MTTLPLTYYVQFRDAAGNLVAGTDGQTWFAVSGVAASVESTINIGSSTTAPTITLNPLTFTLGTDTIDPSLLTAEATGTGFSQIELAGYSGDGSSAVLVTDDMFKDAAIQTLASQDTGVSAAVDYADTVQRFYPTDANGNALPPTVAGYDKLTSQTDTSTNNADGSPGNAPDAPLYGTPPTTATDAPLTFYVQFRNTSGNVLKNSAGQSWFAISGLSVPSEHTPNGNGSGAGGITFKPLSFTMDSTALPTLLSLQAGGATLGAVEVAGYSGTGVAAVLAEDFLDRNAEVQTLTTGPDGSETVALATRDLVQTVYPPAVSGSLALPIPVTGGWDRTANSPDVSTDTQASLVGTPDAAPATPLTYYVQFRSSNGALLTGSDGQSWFAASGVGYGSGQAYNATGAPTGESLAPLTLTLAPDGILAGLFADQASGIPLQQIELAGYDANGTLVTDDAFKGAIATRDNTNADGTDSLAFGYAASTQNTYSTGAGTPGHALDAPAGSVPPTAPDAGTLTYYVQIRLDGGALLKGTGGNTWFAVSDVGFDTTQTLNTGGAGKVGFGALSFTLGADTALPTLFQNETFGTAVQSVELAGYSGSGATATLVADDLFKLADIATDTTQPDGTHALSLQYGGLLQTAYAPGADGTPAVVDSQGWNRVTSSPDDTTAPIGGGTTYALAAPLTGAPATAASPGPLTYYVQFRGYNGSYLSDGKGSTWFAVSDLTLQTAQALAIGSQSSGAGASKVVFSPANFTLDDPLLQPLLFEASARGMPFESVEIAGYSGAGSNAKLVQDDILKLADVAAVQSGSDNSTSLSLNFGGLVERSYTPNASGTVALAQTGGWNRVTNTGDTGTESLPGAGENGASNAAGPVAPLKGTPANVATAAQLTYYVEFRPTASGAMLEDSTGTSFIPVSGLSFTTLQTTDIATASTAGSGRVTFDPLTFTIAPDSVSSTLLSDFATGTRFDSAFLVGYATNGPKPVQTFSDEFKLVAVKGLATNSDGSETVSLEYAGLQETAIAPANNGTLVTTPPQGWDQVKNTSDNYSDISGAPIDSLPNASPACYCPGTRIATPGGEVAVEHLAAGDLVLTADGRALPVVWIGRRSYNGRFVAGRRDILPVTIAAGALADGVPRRDLTVSPEHAMLIDGLLVPARALVNGATITRATRVDAVHYLHVELPQHEAILAEGAASESFADDDSRGAFHNAAEWQGERRPAVYCAPRVESGYELEAIRSRLARRAHLQSIKNKRAG